MIYLGYCDKSLIRLILSPCHARHVHIELEAIAIASPDNIQSSSSVQLRISEVECLVLRDLVAQLATPQNIRELSIAFTALICFAVPFSKVDLSVLGLHVLEGRDLSKLSIIADLCCLSGMGERFGRIIWV